MRSRRVLFLYCCLSVFCLVGFCCKAQPGIDTFARLFPQYKAGAPGYAIGISRSGKLIKQYYTGLANVTYTYPLDSNSVFNVGSISKQFTAACIALLYLRGKLSIDDPVTKYLSDFSNAYRQVKISNLIYHTGGVRSWEMLEMLSGNNPEKGYYNNDKIITLLKKQQGLNFKPGEKFLYSNGGYIILAEIIKRVSGKEMKDFAEENIFQPLGMMHTFFVDDQQRLYNHKVTGYQKNTDGSFYEVIDHNDSYGGGNLHTTIGDLSKWENNYMENRLGFGDELVKLLLTEGKLNNGKPIRYAFGLELENYNGNQVISHTGYWPGFRTRMLVIPRLNYAVTFITNSSDDIHSDRTAFDIVRAYSTELFNNYKDSLSSSPNTELSVKAAIFRPFTSRELAIFTGNYYSKELNKAFLVITYKGHLALKIDADTLELKQTDHFRFSFQDAMIISFSGNANNMYKFRLDVGEELAGLYFQKMEQ